MKHTTEAKLLSLLDRLIDDRIDQYGVVNTIELLMDFNLTDEEIEEYGFDPIDIAKAERY